MKNWKHFAQRYVDWVIKLGRVRFSLLGVSILAVLALCTQIVFSLALVHHVAWIDIVRSVVFGLLTAPFVVYFSTLLVEKLEHSRQDLARSVARLENEVFERMNAQQKLSHALEKLEKNSRDKSTLLATISHELRTPLNGIVGLSQILLDEELDERQRNYLKTINISAVSLGYIFSDIIDLEKIDTSRIELNCQPTDFTALLNDIYNFAEFMAKQKNLNFHLITQPDLPNWLELDRVRLSQILWNLISNAVKFTDHGEIILNVRHEGDDYHFSLTDSGMGIDPEEQPHIFQLYYQVQSSRRQSAGSGIGLAISKNLAKLMQGDLTVESQLGKGSTFHLHIKAKQAQANNLSAKQSLPHLHILLVEDVELNIIVAKTILEKLGHHVDVATDGKQAISLFEKNLYDILLLDIKLPDMTGFEIAQYLRRGYEDGIYDCLPPMVAFTANVMQSEKEYLEMGMDGVLRKPISIKDLNHCLQHFFGDEMMEPLPSEENLSSNFDFTLIDILGKSKSLENLALFKQTMPDYLTILNQGNIKEIEETAHKIKGAAASVGLILLNHLAASLEEQAKQNETSAVQQLISDLQTQWQTQVKQLETYLQGEQHG